MKMIERQKIILNSKCRQTAYCDRNEYFKKYGEWDKNGCFKKLQIGAPIVINISGIYYYYDKLLVAFGGNQICYDNYRRELISPDEKTAKRPPIFIWR